VIALKGTTFEKTVERVGNKNKKIIMWVVTPLIIILIIWRIADYIRTGY
jgi:p-aminobenzoyl-glutamate transporter AbgT